MALLKDKIIINKNQKKAAKRPEFLKKINASLTWF